MRGRRSAEELGVKQSKRRLRGTSAPIIICSSEDETRRIAFVSAEKLHPLSPLLYPSTLPLRDPQASPYRMREVFGPLLTRLITSQSSKVTG